MMSSKSASPPTPSGPPRGRIDVLDVARALALLAMLVYHFTWDLEFFGYLPAGTVFEGGWRLFARAIATSFLLLVGISMVLAQSQAIRWRPFAKRLAQVTLGAIAVTIGTYIFTPQSFVFFGILHQIALASVIGLAFLRTPFWLTALVALAVIALPNLVSSDVTNTRWLAWIGFSTAEPLSNDLVPVFPWTGIVIAGMALAQAATRFGAWSFLQRFEARSRPARWSARLGRHSLAFYLLHQPISIALVAAFAAIWPADRTTHFAQDCARSCLAQEADAAYCERYCGCVEADLRERDLLAALMDGTLDPSGQARVRETILACSFDAVPPAERPGSGGG